MTALGRIRGAIRWSLFRGLFLLSAKRTIEGFEVIDAAAEESERTYQGLHQALQVIEQADPRRFQRLRQDMPRIVLVKAGGPEFASEVDACLLRSGYVRESASKAVASTLVHEGTHARLCRSGIGYGKAIRARVEELCVKEQLAFAERLGDDHILLHLRQKLETPWWTPAQLRERRLTALTDLGVPGWAIRLYRRVTERDRSRRTF